MARLIPLREGRSYPFLDAHLPRFGDVQSRLRRLRLFGVGPLAKTDPRPTNRKCLSYRELQVQDFCVALHYVKQVGWILRPRHRVKREPLVFSRRCRRLGRAAHRK